ncbi:MAG: biopolymer transporter ExbD [Treponema sp.]|nr:biopolymer transporter ExbD [Candidatus Treponema equifaecale]
MKVSNRKKIGVNVDLTPMIDVVFQLILFFLVSTTFAVLPAINVKLPESETAQGADIAGITITATANGKLWFNDEQVTLSTLGVKLAKFDTEGRKKEEYPVTLEADDKVTNGMIVKIFDELRKSGFVAINLRTTDK